jgi:hypothetical protein
MSGNPIPEKPGCANCNKPYRDHLPDTRCTENGDAKWFPKTLAEALTKQSTKIRRAQVALGKETLVKKLSAAEAALSGARQRIKALDELVSSADEAGGSMMWTSDHNKIIAQQAATISQMREALEAMTAAKFGQKQAEEAWGKAHAALANVRTGEKQSVQDLDPGGK